MANIALNKPSGGQLILSPEDGTSTETVTIPSVGVGKVLQVVHTSTNSGTVSTTGQSLVDTGLVINFTPKEVGSTLHIDMSGFFGAGNLSQAGGRACITVDGTIVSGGSSQWVMFSWDRDEDYGLNTYLMGKYTTTSLNTLTIKVSFAAYDAYTFYYNGNYQNGLRVMEVAA